MAKYNPRKGGFFGRTGRIPNAKKKFTKGLWNSTEDMGTVTGPHIAGTGDDSSTVVVKKKKKKKVQVRFKLKNNKSLRKRILDNVLALHQKV